MIGRIARFNRVGAGLLAVLALAFVISGQENTPKKPHGGLVTDWTSRHLVFSSSGTPDMTDKITQDPRYQMQWARRNFHPVVAGGAPESNDVLSPAALLAKKKKVGIEKDWGYEFASTAFSSAPLGGLLFPAKYSFDTSTATCDDYVVYPVDVVGSSTAVFATDSGTVSSTGPTNGQTATITNGANVDTVIATAAMEATANGTVTATTGSNGQTATITNGANVDTITATPVGVNTTGHGGCLCNRAWNLYEYGHDGGAANFNYWRERVANDYIDCSGASDWDNHGECSPGQRNDTHSRHNHLRI